ncbi:restriction endonuclease subunit R [Moorena producens JHB]|uniref:Restriction endonuclease subunit R n=1 Tax=Moorena producens (strain JHB) TaxID=1454205 RepID=A0A1D9GBM6_MOOP1|nr:restriction endonuclease subunit R [Moorena producens]AOY85048.1 restriction endonuclease subunit R [Moorena producens JHB]
MTALQGRKLSLRDVNYLLGIQPLYNGLFAPLLALEPLTETEQEELVRIQDEFRNYWLEGKVSEGQVRLVSVAPLLRLAGFNRPPIKLNVEEEIARIYIEDEDTYITGRFDIVAVNRQGQQAIPLWILVVESQNIDVEVSTGLPQLLTYAFNSLEHQKFVWGLATNGRLYQFVYIRHGNPQTYQYMPILSLFESDRAMVILQVLKGICKL